MFPSPVYFLYYKICQSWYTEVISQGTFSIIVSITTTDVWTRFPILLPLPSWTNSPMILQKKQKYRKTSIFKYIFLFIWFFDNYILNFSYFHPLLLSIIPISLAEVILLKEPFFHLMPFHCPSLRGEVRCPEHFFHACWNEMDPV